MAAPVEEGLERRLVSVDVPADADAELAAMALIIATVEALPAIARSRVMRWAFDRYAEPVLF